MPFGYSLCQARSVPLRVAWRLWTFHVPYGPRNTERDLGVRLFPCGFDRCAHGELLLVGAIEVPADHRVAVFGLGIVMPFGVVLGAGDVEMIFVAAASSSRTYNVVTGSALGLCIVIAKRAMDPS
jgi:hypothetical protein